MNHTDELNKKSLVITHDRNIAQNNGFNHLSERSLNLLLALHHIGFNTETNKCYFSLTELATAMCLPAKHYDKKLFKKEIKSLMVPFEVSLSSFEYKTKEDRLNEEGKKSVMTRVKGEFIIITGYLEREDFDSFDTDSAPIKSKWMVQINPDLNKYIEREWYNKIRFNNYFALGAKKAGKKNVKRMYLYISSFRGFRDRISIFDIIHHFGWKKEAKNFRDNKRMIKKLIEEVASSEMDFDGKLFENYLMQKDYILFEWDKKYIEQITMDFGN